MVKNKKPKRNVQKRSEKTEQNPLLKMMGAVRAKRIDLSETVDEIYSKG